MACDYASSGRSREELARNRGSRASWSRARLEKSGWASTGLRSFQMRFEPGQGAFDYVAAVFGAGEHVAFVFVDYELGFDAEGFEGVPEFVGLRGGDFAIAVADEDERGRFDFLDEIDRRAFGVDVGVVVDGFAEE